MINFFIELYGSIRNKNAFLTSIRFYSVERILVRVVANIILPIYLGLTANREEYQLTPSTDKDKRIIVSLTSFPARIKKVWIVIECLLRQTYPPDKIILWLAKEQFEGRNTLPNNLLDLEKRGLEIVFCDEDLRSHKKYYYAIKKFSKDILITVDDDLIYPTILISRLLDLHKKHPGTICCDRAHRITKEGSNLKSYTEWETLHKAEGPSFKLFFTSGGGTLFPPGALSKEALNKKIFMVHCKYADDIWLNVMAQMNDTKIVKSDAYSTMLPIIGIGGITLTSMNVDQGFNDKQLNSIRKYYANSNTNTLKNIYS